MTTPNDPTMSQDSLDAVIAADMLAVEAGESDVLWVALETADGVAVLDEIPARRVARQLGIPLAGTLGLLVDLEQRLAAIGVRRDRASVPIDELRHLTAEDRQARKVVDA